MWGLPSMKESKSVVCTLTTKALARRSIEWSDLRLLADRVTELDNGVVLELSLDHTDAVHELAEQEMQCCGTWLDIDVVDGLDLVTLRLTTTDSAGVPIIKQLAGLGGIVNR